MPHIRVSGYSNPPSTRVSIIRGTPLVWYLVYKKMEKEVRYGIGLACRDVCMYAWYATGTWYDRDGHD